MNFCYCKCSKLNCTCSNLCSWTTLQLWVYVNYMYLVSWIILPDVVDLWHPSRHKTLNQHCLTLIHCLRPWTNVKQALIQCLVSAGISHTTIIGCTFRIIIQMFNNTQKTRDVFKCLSNVELVLRLMWTNITQHLVNVSFFLGRKPYS